MVSNSKSSKSKLLLAGVAGAGLLVAGGSQVATHADSVKVQSNDTVWALSQKFGVSIKSIESLNNINPQSHLIFTGQNLQIPNKKAKTVSVKKSQFSKVVVKSGDSLSAIANEYGVSVDSIVAANNLSSNLIHVGQVLMVPVAGTPAANVVVQTVVQQPVVQAQVASVAPVSSVASQAPVSSVASVAPVSSVASQVPVSSTASVAPVSSVASQAPVSSTASVAPVSSVASQAPASSTASVAPVSSVASQAPASSTASVAPVSSVASQAPVSSTASVAPVSSVASQAPASSAVQSETTVSSAAQTPVSSVASQAPQQSSAVQTPVSSATNEQVQQSSAVSQAPQQSSAVSQSSAANSSSAATSSSANNTNENANVSGSVTSVARQLANNTIPYVWGGKTPAGFDCSGFVSYVYAHSTGQYLPSYTVAMESYVTDKPVSAANPGDLLFWGDHGSTYHVGIYLGNNQFAAAPQPGENVQVESLSSYFYPSFAGSVN